MGNLLTGCEDLHFCRAALDLACCLSVMQLKGWMLAYPLEQQLVCALASNVQKLMGKAIMKSF